MSNYQGTALANSVCCGLTHQTTFEAARRAAFAVDAGVEDFARLVPPDKGNDAAEVRSASRRGHGANDSTK